MHILCLYQGIFGERIADNLKYRGPKKWKISVLEIPNTLLLIVDDPEEFLPANFSAVDLVLHLTENSQAAQLFPGIIRLSGAKAVIAPIDNKAWIPVGLRYQLNRELSMLGAAIVFPEPFCALTEDLINSQQVLHPERKDILKEFIRYFGRPALRLIMNADETIAEVIIKRGAACGSSHYAADRLCGISAKDVVPKGGLICLHYPCLASMKPTRPKDGVENLMHLSGVIFNEELEKALLETAKYEDS